MFPIFKKNADLGEKTDAANALLAKMKSYEAQLEYDYQQRMNGDGTYSGYRVLREFYKGKQWSYRKDGNGTMRTYNYLYTVVENMTAFLTNEAPQMSSPPRRVDDSIERVLAEERTKILDFVHDDNSLPLVFQRAARVGSLNGDAMIFGSIPTFKIMDSGEKVFDRIRYWNIERPETVRIIWKDDNFAEIFGFVKQYRISVAAANRIFADQIKAGNFTVTADRDPILSGNEPSQLEMVTVKEYWDDKEYLLTFNVNDRVVDYIKHDWGFVPLHWVPNVHLPGEPKGTSDIEHELDAQQEYNERTSDLADVIKEIAQPTYWGKNLDNITEVRAGNRVMYQLGDDAEINAMPASGQTAATENYLSERKRDIISLSGMTEVLYPGASVMQATGRALSVIMQGVNNKISLRKDWWVKAFKDLNKTILFHAEQQIPDAKKVIQGWYKTDVFIASVLMRSVTDEINKFQSKVQSLTTTQKNVGIPNPSEEQKLMKEELQDEILATEIAKQPGLLHQIIAERVAQMNGGGAMGAVGMAGINGAPSPIATESDNTPGAAPAAGGGVPSPVSPAGAIRQQAARAGQPALVRGKK